MVVRVVGVKSLIQKESDEKETSSKVILNPQDLETNSSLGVYDIVKLSTVVPLEK